MFYERGSYGWEFIGQGGFKSIESSDPDMARKKTEALLPLIEGCEVLAGGALSGIPYSVFDRAGLHIFEIREINDDVFDGIIEELRYADVADTAMNADAKKSADAKHIEAPNNIYFLDLIILPEEHPEVISKAAAMDYDVPFLEVRLTCFCRHIPPWVRDSAAYSVQTIGMNDGAIQAVVARTG
jgi:hypothetical protein